MDDTLKQKSGIIGLSSLATTQNPPKPHAKTDLKFLQASGGQILGLQFYNHYQNSTFQNLRYILNVVEVEQNTQNGQS